MLQVKQIRKSYGATVVLDGATFILNDGEHVGLIGGNGTGKSTLLRCIAGEEHPDAGTLVLAPAGATVGYLPQTFAEFGGRSLAEVVAESQAAWVAAQSALEQAADALAGATDAAAALAAYDAALTRFESLGGYEREHRATAILDGLGLGGIDPAMPAASLSGGQKTRLALATLLLREPDLLLLDEPTNHLDVEALDWLEGFVDRYPGAALIVSHDRAFLDRTASRILYLDPRTRTVTSYPGNYTAFAEAREHERQLQQEAWRRQAEYVERVERDIRRLKGEALTIERSTTPRQPGVRKLAWKKARVAKSRERKLERFLESDERVEQPGQQWHLKLDFGAASGSRSVFQLEQVAFAYPGRPSLFEGVSLEARYGERIAVVGPNGAGKTTLLRLLDGRLTPTAGRVRLGAATRPGTLAQEHETLDLDRTVLETARSASAILTGPAAAPRPMNETELRSFLHYFLFTGESVFRKVGECSLGERSRLQLARLVLQGCNLLLLDEPLNHLDVEGREHFEAALAAFSGTVVAVAHDRAFLRAFAERVVDVGGGQVRSFEGGYDDYLARARHQPRGSGAV